MINAFADWRPEKVPDQTGKNILITGAASGIGQEVACQLAERGANIIVLCLSQQDFDVGATAILAREPQASVRPLIVDLGSMESVRTGAEAFMAEYDRLDVLINNAGIMGVPYGKTVDGVEKQFGVNHLGHYLLTLRLLPLLEKTAGARIVVVGSQGHMNLKRFSLDHLDGTGYKPVQAYWYSKLYTIMFGAELDQRLKASNASTLCVIAHPGGTATKLGIMADDAPALPKLLATIMLKLTGHPMENAAHPMVLAATDPRIKGGEYIGPVGFKQLKGAPGNVDYLPLVDNKEDRDRLWALSEQLTGVSFPEKQEG